MDIGDWLTGKMTSRKFLMYIDGLLADVSTTRGWYGQSVRRDAEEMKAEELAQLEREVRAVNKADLSGQPLKMSDLQPKGKVVLSANPH